MTENYEDDELYSEEDLDLFEHIECVEDCAHAMHDFMGIEDIDEIGKKCEEMCKKGEWSYV